MFYVGIVSSFASKTEAARASCSILEKLGHSKGRAIRFLDSHTSYEVDGVKHRPVVFVLPDAFRLNNEVIKVSVRQYSCTWQTAKFHVYREMAVDVLASKEDWAEFFPKEGETSSQSQQPGAQTGSQPGSAVGENVNLDPIGVMPHDVILKAG